MGSRYHASNYARIDHLVNHSAACLVCRAALIISHTRGGDSGSSRGSTPKSASAFATALAMTPPAAIMPPSPAPLAPSGLIGDGFWSVAKLRRLGKSLAVGSR